MSTKNPGMSGKLTRPERPEGMSKLDQTLRPLPLRMEIMDEMMTTRRVIDELERSMRCSAASFCFPADHAGTIDGRQ
jgi:hypothetical protein